MDNSLNEKLVAKVGDIVWFLRPKHTVENDLNDSKIYFDTIEQGKVTSIQGATDCVACIGVIDVNKESVGAVQELFFTNFNECLKVFNKVNGRYFGGYRKDWYEEYMNIVKSDIHYKYELSIPYEKENIIKTNFQNGEYNSIVKRVLFDFSDNYKYNSVSLQVLLEEESLLIELTQKELLDLKGVQIKKFD